VSDFFLRFVAVEKAFGPKKVLRGVNLDVVRGETVVVLGGSGSGKSVLLRHAVGLFRPDAGQVFVEDVEISKLGARFFKSAPELLAVGDDRPDVAFQEAGYLLLATRAGLAVLEQNHAVQVAHGAEVVLLSPRELRERFPWLLTADLATGSLGLRDEGWIDPYSLLMAFKRKAMDLGVTYVHGAVVAVARRGAAANLDPGMVA